MPIQTLLVAGGDDRLTLDPATGRNRYLVGPHPLPGLVLASCTASPPSAAGLAAAAQLHRTLIAGGPECLPAATERMANRIAEAFGVADLARVLLAASGTDATLLALGWLAAEQPGVPLASLLLGLPETGTGVPLAAAGRHFADRTAGGAQVARGAKIEGFPPDMPTSAIPLRDPAGNPLPPATIEAAADAAITAHLRAQPRGKSRPGRVVLHAMEGSKTGLVAPGLDGADRLAARHGPRLIVLADACQARLPLARVRAYLARGWPVLVTGSKFLGGPPFSGAVLFPRTRADAINPATLPAGLAAYTPHGAGLAGLLLRWQAALAAAPALRAPALRAMGEPTAQTALTRLTKALTTELAHQPSLSLAQAPEPSGIFTLMLAGPNGKLGMDALRAVHRRLALENCLLGQPVALGDGGLAGLRLALSASQLAEFSGAVDDDVRLAVQVLGKCQEGKGSALDPLGP